MVTTNIVRLIALALAMGNSEFFSLAADTDWARAFGYASNDIHAIEVRDFGFAFVPVNLGGTQLMLPFDTGDMVGVSISSALFDQIGLHASGSWNRVNGAGEVVARLRVADSVDVSILGRSVGPTRIYELDDRNLPGLVGPTLVGGGHFTLDYGSRRMALSTARLPETVPGFQRVPLVRSRRHPMLVVVPGTIEGRGLLLELDTGKSRTVINPKLVSDLALARRPQGIALKSLRIGALSFEIANAKEGDQRSIATDLPDPILAGLGSDVLCRFVWTVDYESGTLWLPPSR